MRDTPASGLPFEKMHGLGNDFVVLDLRARAAEVTPALARALADRHRGVGCDQVAAITDDPEADLRLTFWNADGSLSAACGNATRCIAAAEMARTGASVLTIATGRGLLHATLWQGRVSVNMGHPQVLWEEIPLAREADPDHLPMAGDPVATGMGNPHCTFFVEDAGAVDLAAFGPPRETDPLFPERTNVQVAQVLSPTRIRVRVWERGAGITEASGSSSCAVAVAAVRRGLAGRHVTIVLDGGELDIDWRDDGVWMTGPTAHVFSGALTPAFLAEIA